MSSITEVDSLAVSKIQDVPGILRLAIVVGLDLNGVPMRTMEDTARHLKSIGLEKRVLPTSAISYIEHQAFAKLRRNPKILEMYKELSGWNHRVKPRTYAARVALATDEPTAIAKSLVSEMHSRRIFARARREARSEVPV